MYELNKPRNPYQPAYIVAFLVILVMAFVQGYKFTHDLHWASEPDFDRDISFVQSTLDGHFSKDPSYAGEYMWYTPLLFSIETVIVKATGLPIHDVVTRAGAYLNLLAPICFFLLLWSLLGVRVALAGALSFLFLATGNIIACNAASYSPWLFPVNFVQFLFYLSVLFCYKAYSAQKYYWFILLGILLGITFLGHAAPTIILILMLAILHVDLMWQAIRKKEYKDIKKYLLQAIAVFIPFVLASLPLTHIVAGKYHFHIINREPSQYTEGIFYIRNWKEMLKENISVSFVIAVIGFIGFYRKFPGGVIKKLLLSWVAVTTVMYIYSTGAYIAERQFHIRMPVTVASFHYFFYFKAAQSVFFGLGLVSLLQLIPLRKYSEQMVIGAVLLCAFIYYPFYKNRVDFVKFRNDALVKENDKDKMDVYNYIVQHVPEEDVILCEKDPSLFPVMPTARKMVSTAFTFSNPYVDFNVREKARLEMLSYIKTGQPIAAQQLFLTYNVHYIVLFTEELQRYSAFPALPGDIVYKNNTYVIFAMRKIPENT